MHKPIALTDPPMLALMLALACACVLGLIGVILIDTGWDELQRRRRWSGAVRLVAGIALAIAAGCLAWDGWPGLLTDRLWQ